MQRRMPAERCDQRLACRLLHSRHDAKTDRFFNGASILGAKNNAGSCEGMSLKQSAFPYSVIGPRFTPYRLGLFIYLYLNFLVYVNTRVPDPEVGCSPGSRCVSRFYYT